MPIARDIQRPTIANQRGCDAAWLPISGDRNYRFHILPLCLSLPLGAACLSRIGAGVLPEWIIIVYRPLLPLYRLRARKQIPRGQIQIV